MGEVVVRLRETRLVGNEEPHFGVRTLGEVFDRMIQGPPEPLPEPLYLPTIIALQTKPYRAELIWYGQDGAHQSTEKYVEVRPPLADVKPRLIVKKTFIDPLLIQWVAERLKNDPKSKRTARSRAIASK